jgi:glycine/D-amino acid oxidase-like deaminating enzyme
VVLCTGATHTGIAGQHLSGYARLPVRRVRLQMLQTEPFGQRLTTSIADGDSLRYYPAYDLPARAGLAEQPPAAAAAHAQLLATQRLDGSLTIGDTHAYAAPFAFDVDEEPYIYHRSHVASGVVLVTGPGGRGMTVAPAIAEQTFADTQEPP